MTSIFGKSKNIKLPNLKEEDYIIKFNICDSGYKIYNNGFEDHHLLVEAKLSKIV